MVGRIEVRYEYNCVQWMCLPGPDEEIFEDAQQAAEAARYFDDAVATAGVQQSQFPSLMGCHCASSGWRWQLILSFIEFSMPF